MVDARRVPCLRRKWTTFGGRSGTRTAEVWPTGGRKGTTTTPRPPTSRSPSESVEITLDDDRRPAQAVHRDTRQRHAIGCTCCLKASQRSSPTTRIRGRRWMSSGRGRGRRAGCSRRWHESPLRTSLVRLHGAALLPTPSPHSWDPDIDRTLTRARDNWIQPDALVGLDERWLQPPDGNRRQSTPSSSSAGVPPSDGNQRPRRGGLRP